MANLRSILKSGMAGALPVAIAGDPNIARNLGVVGTMYANEEEMRRAQQGMKKGGKVKSASSRADGCAVKGKTRGKMV